MTKFQFLTASFFELLFFCIYSTRPFSFYCFPHCLAAPSHLPPFFFLHYIYCPSLFLGPIQIQIQILCLSFSLLPVIFLFACLFVCLFIQFLTKENISSVWPVILK
ncbi:hypothetical protein I7I53_01130 [Histoplasma capsulatum var. duboisii H88]|uniref:Uncharacterized protein n=1 Tax=Ajellomyces capsulatus (strain H88) TaxID=544711 RepID=A0A8A1LPA8_AJEC8|nr:hypothetical protein I7I53_01130 [Histoplasma capsulatum var. duboisii H88]